MGFNFERFDQLGTSFVPKISLRTNGTIGVSQGALHKFSLIEGDWYVVLHYDKTARVIGIQPTKNPDETSAMRLVINRRKSVTAHISARSFLDYFDINYRTGTTPYLAKWDDEHKIIIVDLNKPMERREACEIS